MRKRARCLSQEHEVSALCQLADILFCHMSKLWPWHIRSVPLVAALEYITFARAVGCSRLDNVRSNGGSILENKHVMMLMRQCLEVFATTGACGALRRLYLPGSCSDNSCLAVAVTTAL